MVQLSSAAAPVSVLSHAHAAPKAERPGVAAVLSISTSMSSWSAGPGERVPVALALGGSPACIHKYVYVHGHKHPRTHAHTRRRCGGDEPGAGADVAAQMWQG